MGDCPLRTLRFLTVEYVSPGMRPLYPNSADYNLSVGLPTCSLNYFCLQGCYAPNGFHSEKPVLCALSVDNRILTVFKEEKNGRREEIEDVEIKLFEAGMYVYGLHSSGHDYVTDELWAAFYKLLLDKRLVPKIVLSNESPGFDWIKKHKFAQPGECVV